MKEIVEVFFFKTNGVFENKYYLAYNEHIHSSYSKLSLVQVHDYRFKFMSVDLSTCSLV